MGEQQVIENVRNDKKGIRFYLHIYRMILAQDIKAKLSYRADFFISMIGMLAVNIGDFIAFWILFQKFPSIMGWKYEEMIFLYGFSLLALTPVQCLFDNNWNLRFYVTSGDFIKYCFRPINLFFYFMSEVFDLKGIGQGIFGLVTVIYAWNRLGIAVSPLLIVQFIIAVFAASLFMIAIYNFAAATCFWFVQTGYIIMFVNKFKDYIKYPVTVFNPIFRFVFSFIIPIAFAAFYPCQTFLRPDAVPVLTYVAPFLGIIYFYLSYLFWMKGARSYSGTGS